MTTDYDRFNDLMAEIEAAADEAAQLTNANSTPALDGIGRMAFEMRTHDNRGAFDDEDD